jgi:hypothetical protein
MIASDLTPVLSPAPRVGHFSPLLLVYSCQAPKGLFFGGNFSRLRLVFEYHLVIRVLKDPILEFMNG